MTSWIVLAVLLVVGILLFLGLRSIKNDLHDRIEETPSHIDDILAVFILSIRPWIYFLILFLIATFSFDLHATTETIRNITLLILSTYQIISSIIAVIEIALKKFKAPNKHEEKLFTIFSKTIGFSIWIVGVLFILSNVGINIAALLTGFGIGGIAIAFALQSVLKDLFSYLTILLDQPIKEGDIIEVQGREGSVSHIGIKTTRLRTPGGEEIVLSNDLVASSDLKNYGTAETRRVTFSIFIEHETGVTKLEKLPKQITKIIESIPELEPSISYIKSITAAGIELTTIYYVNTRTVSVHRDTQHNLHLALHRLLRKERVGLVHADIVANQ